MLCETSRNPKKIGHNSNRLCGGTANFSEATSLMHGIRAIVHRTTTLPVEYNDLWSRHSDVK
eukprot:scaffold1833_cov263-Chaetoceros_neogracile.AAC.15